MTNREIYRKLKDNLPAQVEMHVLQSAWQNAEDTLRENPNYDGVEADEHDETFCALVIASIPYVSPVCDGIDRLCHDERAYSPEELAALINHIAPLI